MHTVKILVLRDDILSTVYTNSTDCAITRAYERAGLPLQDVGQRAKLPNGGYVGGDEYKDIVYPVVDMYFRDRPVGDIELEIPFSDTDWEKIQSEIKNKSHDL